MTISFLFSSLDLFLQSYLAVIVVSKLFFSLKLPEQQESFGADHVALDLDLRTQYPGDEVRNAEKIDQRNLEKAFVRFNRINSQKQSDEHKYHYAEI